MNTYQNEATYTPQKHGFYWFSNGKDIKFPLKWFQGEPNFPQREHCLQADFRNGVIGLNDNVCNSELYFICELNDCPKKF